jgi:hypothetical protein
MNDYRLRGTTLGDVYPGRDLAPKADGQIASLHSLVAKTMQVVAEIRAHAGTTADRLMGPQNEATGGISGQNIPVSRGEVGDLTDGISALLREAEAALSQVRRFEGL